MSTQREALEERLRQLRQANQRSNPIPSTPEENIQVLGDENLTPFVVHSNSSTSTRNGTITSPVQPQIVRTTARNDIHEIRLSDLEHVTEGGQLSPSIDVSIGTFNTNDSNFNTSDSHVSFNQGNLVDSDNEGEVGGHERPQADLWRDTRVMNRNYVEGRPVNRQTNSLLDNNYIYQRSQSTRPPVDRTYETAFRFIQQAADAERRGDPTLAINLYSDAGDVLVEVGRNEKDPLLRQGIKEKATEIIKRAEELDAWSSAITESAARDMLPPQQKIQRMDVPRVQEAWGHRKPTYFDGTDFTHMRYTAVTTKDPFQFTYDGYVLRVDEYGKKIRVFITITMYNEDGNELKGTLTGIAKNLEYMAKQWGDLAWESVAVAVVSDGRTKASSSCLEYLTSLGAFDEEIMTVASAGVDVHMHLFESTIQLLRDDNFESYYPPLQLIFALKEHNGGKLNSHLWFFNAFSEQLLPIYTVLIDVGTIPGHSSIYRLIRSMDRNPQIGGVAGEIAVEAPNYFNPVIAAQHFEYKISNIMDKSLESVFGFISVLPGAFSAYRYEAIRAEKGEGPLPEYFKSLTTSTKELGPFKGNMYLAEDRILCFELLARPGRNWTMHYVKDAIACTDVPETLVDLIKQRRRWLNGSFFAGLFAISNFGRVWKDSRHSISRKIVLSFQFLYLLFQNLLSWFLLSNLFLTFYYVLTLALYKDLEGVLTIVLGIYLSLVSGIVIFALGNRPEKRTAAFYSFAFVFFGLVMLFVSVISIYGLFSNIDINDPRDDLVSCSVTDFELTMGVTTALGLIFLAAFLHGEFSILLSTMQYFFMLPTFVNILGIYAYSNLHDLSWGTKGLESGGGHGPAKGAVAGSKNLKEIVAQQKREEAARQRAAVEATEVENSFRAFRSTLLLFWLVSNCVWVYTMTTFISSSCYLLGLSYIVAIFNVTRFLGACVFLCFRIARRFGKGGRNGGQDSAYQHQLPVEWQNHFQRSQGGGTQRSTNTLNSSNPQYTQVDILSPARQNAHYTSM